MEDSCHPAEPVFRLKFDGKMTYEFYRELEDRIIDAMHRYKRLEVDLSEVSEIDLCGIHLIGLLKNVGAIVAISPVVEQASKGLLVSFDALALGGSERSE